MAATSAFACFSAAGESRDNMIYRLVENVEPYYWFESNHSLLYATEINAETENLALWRKQTDTKLSDERLREIVYKVSRAELVRRKAEVEKNFGQDGYRLLYIAKSCEEFRTYKDDPWYYPIKNDPRFKEMELLLTEVQNYSGRYATRYALQAERIMVALKKYPEAVKYWEQTGKKLEHDAVWNLAERHAARAYLMEGDTLTAANIYVRHGDLTSLTMCRLDKADVWELVYEFQPDSPYFMHELQFLLTHVDNEACSRDDSYCWYGSTNERRARVDAALKLADRVIREKRVKNMAMWYYAQAALLDAKGQKRKAMQVAREGEKLCEPGTFLATSMRVLRILTEAEVLPLDANYETRLCEDLKWIDSNGRKNLTTEIKNMYYPQKLEYEDYNGDTCEYYTAVEYTNRYYWNDVLNRIVVDVVSERLKKADREVDALMYSNLGVHWIMKNVYGEASSKNSCTPFFLTDYANDMTEIADSCKVSELVKMYERLQHPVKDIDHLVVANGQVSRDYWCDFIGTRYIAESNYTEAARWLKQVSHEFQCKMAVFPYCNRDPFCYKIGWHDSRRSHLKNKYDYKLNFANEMAALENTMKSGATADERGKAMIRYGVGLRNQKQWAWALTRYRDTADFYYADKEDADSWYGMFVDISDSKLMIEKGIATLESRELKAHYLHLFARNKEVMDNYADTKTARNLRAHCDMWRDYAKK